MDLFQLLNWPLKLLWLLVLRPLGRAITGDPNWPATYPAPRSPADEGGQPR